MPALTHLITADLINLCLPLCYISSPRFIVTLPDCLRSYQRLSGLLIWVACLWTDFWPSSDHSALLKPLEFMSLIVCFIVWSSGYFCLWPLTILVDSDLRCLDLCLAVTLRYLPDKELFCGFGFVWNPFLNLLWLLILDVIIGPGLCVTLLATLTVYLALLCYGAWTGPAILSLPLLCVLSVCVKRLCPLCSPHLILSADIIHRTSLLLSPLPALPHLPLPATQISVFCFSACLCSIPYLHSHVVDAAPATAILDPPPSWLSLHPVSAPLSPVFHYTSLPGSRSLPLRCRTRSTQLNH